MNRSAPDEVTPGEERPVEFQWPADRPGDHRAAAVPEPPPAASARAALVQWTVSGLGLAGGIAVYLAPTPGGLSAQGQAACAVFLLCTTLWITDVVPIGVTGLLAVALLGLTGAMKPGDAYAAFGNSAVFFIIGVFILAAAIIHSGLSKRLALFFLRRFQRGPQTLASGVMLTAAFMTVWMPAQATAAMLFPITLELAGAMGLRRHTSEYAKVLFLSLAWGAMIGSNASFLGSTRAPLALGILQSTYGQTISFGQWFAASFPVVVLGAAVGLVVLRFWFRREAVDLQAARDAIGRSVRDLGPMGRRQAVVAMIVGATVCAWVVLGGRVDLAAISLLAAAALFATGALRWQDLEGYVHWGIVLMYGGAIALGQAVESTGAARWLVSGVVDDGAIPTVVAVTGLALLTVLLTEFMSNAAAVAVMLPLGFSLADQTSISPVAIVLTCSLAAGLDFTFPFSSAPNTIAYSSGYLRMRDMLGVGMLMTVLQVLLLLLVSLVYWPLIGVL
jgi:sodium-dependent dicarboxylate transporter 2/3/5